MSIQSNSEGLQRILQTVNALPDAGSGVTVQKKTGTVTTSSSTSSFTSVDCGFQADLVVIHKGETESGYYSSVALAFEADRGTKIVSTFWYDAATRYVEIFGEQTATGFRVRAVYYDDNDDARGYAISLNYVAVKYT